MKTIMTFSSQRFRPPEPSGPTHSPSSTPPAATPARGHCRSAGPNFRSASDAIAMPAASTANTNGLRLNFRNAPLDEVLIT